MPTHEPVQPVSLPSIGLVPPPPAAPVRPRLRIAGLVGAFMCFAWCIAFFLTWIEFPPAERERIHQALGRRLALRRARHEHEREQPESRTARHGRHTPTTVVPESGGTTGGGVAPLLQPHTSTTTHSSRTSTTIPAGEAGAR